MHKQLSIDGEDLIGLLGVATDRYAVVSRNFKGEDVLSVPAIKTSIYGTNLIGLFCAGNSNGLVLPYCVDKEDIEALKRALKEQGVEINIEQVDDTYNALGNMAAANDKAAVISPKFKSEKAFRDALDVEVVKRAIGGHDETGSCLLATNKGFLAHPDAEAEIDELEEILKVEGKEGTANFGYPFIGSALLANGKGYITGARTSGIELGRIDDALGFF